MCRRLGSVELQANELLHALPVLHLSGAVGGVLTCGTVALCLSHLLVHLGQPQPAGGGKHSVGHYDSYSLNLLNIISVERPIWVFVLTA